MVYFGSVYHLRFGDHMHDLDAAENDTRPAEVLESEHWSDDAFDGPMVLFNHVVQILDLKDLVGCVALGVHRVQRGQIGSALVDRHRLGYAVLPDRFFGIPLGSSLVTRGSQKIIDLFAFLVYGPVKVLDSDQWTDGRLRIVIEQPFGIHQWSRIFQLDCPPGQQTVHIETHRGPSARYPARHGSSPRVA